MKQKSINFNCTYPWTGILIDPTGMIKLCCLMNSKSRLFNKHISEVDSLIDFFNGKEYKEVRKEFEEKTWRNVKECGSCRRIYDDGRYCSVIESQSYDPTINKLQFLEFTASNICNQSCVMCSSKFSNQWIELDKLFDDPRHRSNLHTLSDKDIDKICDCLKDLKKLVIKGGEPFADLRNYKILKKLFETNKTSEVHIVTNGSIIAEKYMKILSNNAKKKDGWPRIYIFASIDAVGKRYEWIRGTPWEKTNNTLKKLYEKTGIKSQLVPTMSVYNINSTSELIEWAKNSEYIDDNPGGWDGEIPWYKNDVTWPEWADPRKVFKQEEIDTVKDLPFPLKSNFDEYIYKQHLKYTKIMNNIRGFDIDIWGDMK
tara:strand:+ start:237 stop:1349 length:1113 start_codon:yes stop_codon:yes gene_type:complete